MKYVIFLILLASLASAEVVTNGYRLDLQHDKLLEKQSTNFNLNIFDNEDPVQSNVIIRIADNDNTQFHANIAYPYSFTYRFPTQGTYTLDITTKNIEHQFLLDVQKNENPDYYAGAVVGGLLLLLLLVWLK